jgi:hypothetical protein
LYEIVDVAGRRINLRQISTAKKMAQEDHEVSLRLNGAGLAANVMDNAMLKKYSHGKVARFRIIEM